MEKLQKDEDLENQLEGFKEYGFNVDDLINMLNSEEVSNEDDE